MEAVERGNVLLLRALLVQMRLELSVVSRTIELAPLIHCDCWNAVVQSFLCIPAKLITIPIQKSQWSFYPLVGEHIHFNSRRTKAIMSSNYSFLWIHYGLLQSERYLCSHCLPVGICCKGWWEKRKIDRRTDRKRNGRSKLCLLCESCLLALTGIVLGIASPWEPPKHTLMCPCRHSKMSWVQSNFIQKAW